MSARPEPPVPVLFLAGVGRSGTTLVERTLGETPGVTALGEVEHLWQRGLVRNELCGCGVPFLACPFWNKVGDLAFGGWHRVDTAHVEDLRRQVDRTSRVPAVVTGAAPALRHAAEAYADLFNRVYAAAHEITGDVLVDSSKQVSLAWCLRLTQQFPGGVDLRLVHCVRDPRGVAASWARETRRPEATDAEHATMPRYGAATLAGLWMLHNAEAEALAALVPSARLRYEDFVADPVGATRTMLDLAGVEADADHVTPAAVRLGEAHTCAGNPVRFHEGDLPLVADERWRRDLGLVDRTTVTALTMPLLLRYGYRP